MKAARLLVVDDEPGMLRAVERILSPHYDVQCAADAVQALAAAAAQPPDLGILDIRMPEIDGFELMARLRAVSPTTDFILMTGSATEPDRKLVRAIREEAFYFIQKPFDREVLETLVARCLELRRLARENRSHVARLELELASARTFQQRLLPEPQARVEGFEIDFRYVPCSALGGDFCDYARAGDGRAAVIVADVSGHGVSAAMLTGIVKSAFHAAVAEGYEPRAVVRRVSEALASFSAERFVTLIALRLAGGAGGTELEFVNAGHPPGLLWRGSGGVSRLQPTGPIVSPALPREFCRWEQKTESLRAGDGVLLYTDGASEALSEGDDFFGEDRLAAAALAPGNEGARLDRILTAIRAHGAGRPLEDDLTLLCARAQAG
jgi:sigma-B regulation protein RsbU (phosphoserine phosphatase)